MTYVAMEEDVILTASKPTQVENHPDREKVHLSKPTQVKKHPDREKVHHSAVSGAF